MNAVAKIVLSEDQQNAAAAFSRFLIDPIETVFVLEGYSGTGKSTLVKHLLDGLENNMKAIRLLDPNFEDYEVALTATTNKAAEALSGLTGNDVRTIHSFLGLRVQTDYKTGVTRLIPRTADAQSGYILFIDEASYIDKHLLNHIFNLTYKCKIVFIGDPAQITPVKSSETPVFAAKFLGAKLRKVVRQCEGNPIIELSTLFRKTVETGEFFNFVPDGQSVAHLPRDKFDEAILAEMSRKDWKNSDSKVLAWTNKCTINYNHAIREHSQGDPELQVGDYAICNSFITSGKGISFKTDELVQITKISEEVEEYGVKGKVFQINHYAAFFMPNHLADRNKRIKEATAKEDRRLLHEIDTQWVDLRGAYACTINKAQGSTYDKVFIDLDDVCKCNSGDQIARMLYVAVSRARTKVYLTGDFV